MLSRSALLRSASRFAMASTAVQRLPGYVVRAAGRRRNVFTAPVGHKSLEFPAQAAMKPPMRRFSFSDPDFDERFDAFLAERRGMPADVDEAVAGILEAVLVEGLEA